MNNKKRETIGESLANQSISNLTSTTGDNIIQETSNGVSPDVMTIDNYFDELNSLLTNYKMILIDYDKKEYEFNQMLLLISEKTTSDGKKMYKNDTERDLAMRETYPQLYKDLNDIKRYIKVFDYKFRTVELKINHLLMLEGKELKNDR